MLGDVDVDVDSIRAQSDSESTLVLNTIFNFPLLMSWALRSPRLKVDFARLMCDTNINDLMYHPWSGFVLR